MRVRVSQVKPSNCFRRLEKLVLPSIFYTSLSSFMMWNLQRNPTTVLNEKMWHFRAYNTLTPLTYFQGVRTPNSHDQRPWKYSHTWSSWVLFKYQGQYLKTLFKCYLKSVMLRPRGQTDLEAKIFDLGLDMLASASSIWTRPGLGLVNLASKMCYPMQNNIGCVHFVVVSLQHSLQRRG